MPNRVWCNFVEVQRSWPHDKSSLTSTCLKSLECAAEALGWGRVLEHRARRRVQPLPFFPGRTASVLQRSSQPDRRARVCPATELGVDSAARRVGPSGPRRMQRRVAKAQRRQPRVHTTNNTRDLSAWCSVKTVIRSPLKARKKNSTRILGEVLRPVCSTLRLLFGFRPHTRLEARAKRQLNVHVVVQLSSFVTCRARRLLHCRLLEQILALAWCRTQVACLGVIRCCTFHLRHSRPRSQQL